VYPLASDPGMALATKLGILTEYEERQFAVRTTYLVDPDGTILRVWTVGRGEAIDVHPDEVLAEVRRLAPR
jgi:peroxiredoxin